MSEELESMEGVSRRSMLKKSALVGGTMVWAAPVVQSIATPAFSQDATGTPEGDTQAISFVAILLDCGGQYYRVKWEADGFNIECGRTFSVDACATQLMKDSLSVAEGCPTGVSSTGTLNSDGTLTVNLGSCTIVDYVVKCGSGAYDTNPNDGTGCQDYPEDVVTPLAGGSGTQTFYPCSTTGPTGS